MSEPAAPRLHILEIETFGCGGLTHYAYNLSLALAARGHEVTLVTGAGYELDDATPTAGSVRIVKAFGRLGRRYAGRLPSFVLAALRKIEALFDGFAVASLAARLRPDVIHFHCTHPISLFYLRLLDRLGPPLVVTAHVVTPHERVWFQHSIYRRIHRVGRLIVAHSRFDRRRLLEEFGVATERVTVIPHGEYGFFDPCGQIGERPEARDAARGDLGLGSGDEVALFFGYIREYKGLDVLLEAWPAVAKSRPAARLVVAGDPVRLTRERRDQLESWAERLGAIHRFGYVPFSEVGRYFAAADVLVMPYRHISQSGVLYLSLALGVPVVATRVGGLPELLRHGENALLVAPESPDGLARALGRLLGDGELRERLAAGGRRLAAEHSWPAVAAQTEEAMAKLLSHHRSRT